MVSKEALLKATGNYETIIDMLNQHILPTIKDQNSRSQLVQAIKMGYKDVALLNAFIESKHD